MNSLIKGLLIALVQVALVAAVAGKLLYDRHALPRAWVQTAGVDPVLPIRGRYVSLNLLFEAAPESASIAPDVVVATGVIVVRDGRPLAVMEDPATVSDAAGLGFTRRQMPEGMRWMLVEPVAFFLPEHARDPTRDARPGELWVEATFPRRGAPRPIRLRRGASGAEEHAAAGDATLGLLDL